MTKSKILQPEGTKILLLGNEAIARGAVEAGVQVVTAYPGTPSSEIVEELISVADDQGFYAEWSVNEKVAFEAASGAAVVGAPSLCAMKGAGLNVVMDMFMTLPITGVRGSLVLVVADDPGAHYSSNEQDSRYAALWAGVPCLEPADQQEAKEMTRIAFDLSEQTELPVLVRSVTRISHASGVVNYGAIGNRNAEIGFNKHWKLPYRWNVYGPPGLVEKHKWQLERLEIAREWLGEAFQEMNLCEVKKGIIATGVAASYAREVLRDNELEDKVSFWKVGTVFPFPEKGARRFLESHDEILVVEEGASFFESQLRSFAQKNGFQVTITGQGMDTEIKPYGDLNYDIVNNVIRGFSGIKIEKDKVEERLREEISSLIIPRSSTLCAGCPHSGSYYALRKALTQGATIVPIINGDIGCYEQAGYGIKGQMPRATDQNSRRDRSKSVYNFLDTLYVMGSGISMAQGQIMADYADGDVVAVAGDSTFFHSTLPALVNAVWHQSDITFLVMDNSWVCMTGHQPSPVTFNESQREKSQYVDIEASVRGIGVEWVKTVDPYDISETTQVISEALDYKGPSVVILERECALQTIRREGYQASFYVDVDLCNGCRECVYLGCPAITYHDKKAGIEEELCIGCGLCVEVCPQSAIIKKEVTQE